MVGGPFYLLNATASGSSHGSLRDGGSAPSVSVTSTGWTVGKVVAGDYSEMVYNTKNATGTFGATVLPNKPPVLNDCWRTQNPLSGTYPAGNWTIAMSFESVTHLNAGTSNLVVAMWSSVSQNSHIAGDPARKISGANIALSGFTTASTGVQVNTTGTWVAPAFTLSGEYLFMQCACQITVAGSSTTSDMVFVQDGTNSKITPTTFTPITDLILLPHLRPRGR
jgi:hypothetical protein